MKHIKFLLFTLFFMPVVAFGATDFQKAAQLLSAAKNADIGQVQLLVNDGANINYTDSTGLSLVCTALMNNDIRAAQILQMYGADASKCDQQIKKYNSKKPKTESGGLFSGLSSAQSIALAAAGAAVVVGGLFLLTDVFDSGNNNDSGGSQNNCRPNATCTCSNGTTGTCNSSGVCSNCGTSGGGTPTIDFALPYGPAYFNASGAIVYSDAAYQDNLNYYSNTIEPEIIKENYNEMTNNYQQNYLLMMHGYSPLAHGYDGMRTLRNMTTHAPIWLAGNNLGTEPVLGDRPVNVAMVSANGINIEWSQADYTDASATTNSSLGDKLMPWTSLNNNGTAANPASNNMISSKYYNNKLNVTNNTNIFDDWAEEDFSKLYLYDFSNSGTALNNSFAIDSDNMLAKVITGKDSGYEDPDFMGFMPNGQMTIFRTGGGKAMKTADNSVVGGYTDNGTTGFGTGDVLNLFGKVLNVVRDAKGYGFTATNDADVDDKYFGYVGLDGLLYIDTDGDGQVNAYGIDGTDLKFAKELTDADYYNYKALINAGAAWVAGDLASGRSRVDVIANSDVIEPLHARDAATISDILAVAPVESPQWQAELQSAFTNLVNKYYNFVDTDGAGGSDAKPGADAGTFFGDLGSAYSPLVIFSTGSFRTDDTFEVGNNWSGKTLDAGFENVAPLIFNDLEHIFMSAVAVGLTGNGTAGTVQVSNYVSGTTPSNTQIALMQWTDTMGTPATTDDKYYKARACGVAGTGANGIDPWCFAAAGITDEMAVSSLAGAAGALKSAFSYLNNKQLFALMALTADGPFLASNMNGTAMSQADLISQLKNMYMLPAEYDYRWRVGGENYLDVFKEVFGYGLVNLERATKPTSKIYYYSGTSKDIVSGDGNAYWRKASNTAFRTSGAFGAMRTASISAPFYDVLTSTDGAMTLPRIWENEFALGVTDERGLYMGDVLGEFKVRDTETPETKIGDMSFSMSMSDKQYNDNMGGLDNMQFGYGIGDIEMRAGYQRHFTDGASRFDGSANPILALASNAVSADTRYNMGKWSVGARAFSGNVTDEGLLQNDPTVSSQYMPMQLGRISGAESIAAWKNDIFGFTASFGATNESNTILGAQTGGLLGLSAADTIYIDAVAKYSPMSDITLSLRSTFARTSADATGEFIMGISDVESNAFSAGIDCGKFSFVAALPLAVTNGNMQYAHAEYAVVEDENGLFDLNVIDTRNANMDLRPTNREVRFSGAYRQKLGEFTDGAIGFIYRINPNNTDAFGDESVLMFKINHRLGI